MSDFGLFEAAQDAEQAPSRKQRIAARQMSAALDDISRSFGAFVGNADGPDNFEDRWASIRPDVRKVLLSHQIGTYPAVMREAYGHLKSSWYNRYSAAEGFVEPKGDKDRQLTINDRQKAKVDKGDKTVTDEVKSNSGDGSDAQGNHKAMRMYAEDFKGDLDPAGNFSNYLDGVDRGGPEKVDRHDFADGGDTGSDKREAMQLVADLYTDWAQSNGFRVASMNTLDVYAGQGLHGDDYRLLANLVYKAECECDDDDKDSDDDSSEGRSESSDDSGPEDGDGDSDSSDESGSGDNPFAGGDDDSDDEGDDDFGDDGSDEGADDAPPADSGDDGGDPEDPYGGDEADPTGDQDFPGDPDDDGSDDPEAAAAQGGDVDPSMGGDQFTVPDQAPDLDPAMQQELPSDVPSDGEPAQVPPDVIDSILGLPPGTIEQLVTEEIQNAQGGGDAPPSGPPPQLARRRQRRAAEDPTQAAGDPAAAAQPQMPAAPPAGAGSAGTMAPPGAGAVAPPPPAQPLENQPKEDQLLDTALQSVTQMIDQTTQQYQQKIDPLSQALQAIEFAQQVETAENPLDVTPPDGTVDVDPSAAPGGADSVAEKAARIANRYNLSRTGYDMLMTAMSRKHYEHVGEAIRTLPPEYRAGIADHIGGMFHDDNPRFNHDKWMGSVGVVASRRPFVANPGLKPTQTMDAFEFPGQGKTPQIKDNLTVNDLPKAKGALPSTASVNRDAKGVLDEFDNFTKKRVDKGLNLGPAANVDAFKTEEGPKFGPKALDKLDKTISAGRRQADFFTRRVPGWKWDDHLAGYVSKQARNFTCSCGNEIPTPSYGTCRCGKLWNSYAIGDGNHYAGNSADMFITREIPVRDDVIMANRQMSAGMHQAWTSSDGWTPPDQRDIDWETDEDREDADAPHAPGKNVESRLAWDAAQVRVAEIIGQPVSRHDDPSFQGVVTHADPEAGTAWVQHPGGHHEMSLYDLSSSNGAPQPSLKDKVRQRVQEVWQARPQNGGFAGGRSAFFQEGALKDDDYIVKYDDDGDPARKDGPKKPPSTTVKGGDPKWHTRGDQGKFKSTSPFGG